MRLDDARLLATSGQSPVTVDIVGQLDSKPLSLRGSIGPMAALMAGTGPYPVDLQAKVGARCGAGSERCRGVRTGGAPWICS